MFMPMFSDTSQGCALRRRGEGRVGEEGEAAHINHMKLLLDIRARAPRLDWARRSAVRCDAMRCDCDCDLDLMPVERWDQLSCEVCCEFGLAWGMRRGAMDNILGRRVGKEDR